MMSVSIEKPLIFAFLGLFFETIVSILNQVF
jgi:hypothetical protein